MSSSSPLLNSIDLALNSKSCLPGGLRDSIYSDGKVKNKRLFNTNIINSNYSRFNSLVQRLFDGEFTNILNSLNKSFDVQQTFNSIKTHTWKVSDAQYILVGLTFLNAYILVDNPGFILKNLLILLLITALLLPITSQFFFPALPIFSWLVTFYSASFIPISWRSKINVKFLPAIETIFYGDDLSNILATTTLPILDILAWIPYGVIHFVIPFVTAVLIFIFGPPTSLRCYAFSFGYMNLFGVFLQLLTPCAAPWYKILYGLHPADYSVKGSPGGLANVDKILGVNMYTNSFGASPMVFGALPSLHAGCAVMVCLFLSYIFPRYYKLWYGYVLWIWWSTMYLTHHYFVDLVCGSALSFVIFHLVKHYMLPKLNINCETRWNYSHLEYELENSSSANLLKKNIDSSSSLSSYNSEDLDLVDDFFTLSSLTTLPISSPPISSSSPLTPTSPIIANLPSSSEYGDIGTFVSGHMKQNIFNLSENSNNYRKINSKEQD